jgi:hypothetical protein
MLDRDPFAWRTSSYSGDANGNCVEVAIGPDVVHIRDTKDRDGGTHRCSRVAWSSLLTMLR